MTAIDETALVEAERLEIKDPKELKKYLTAIEILKYIAEDGMSVQSACEQAGIAARTYYRWIEQGIFRTLIGGVVTQAFHQTQLKVISELPQIIDTQINIAKGTRSGVTNFDIHNAAKFLTEKILDPAMTAFLAEAVPPPEEEEKDSAQDFLDAKKDWENIPPGEKLVETTTRVVERQVPTVVEVEARDPDPEEVIEQTPSEDDPA